MKMSEVTPVSIMTSAPHALSTLDGKSLSLNMVIKVPCFKNYYQRLGDLVDVGEVHYLGGNFYFILRQHPMTPKLPSLRIEEDISYDQLREMHLPSIQDLYE